MLDARLIEEIENTARAAVQDVLRPRDWEAVGDVRTTVNDRHREVVDDLTITETFAKVEHRSHGCDVTITVMILPTDEGAARGYPKTSKSRTGWYSDTALAIQTDEGGPAIGAHAILVMAKQAARGAAAIFDGVGADLALQ